MYYTVHCICTLAFYILTGILVAKSVKKATKNKQLRRASETAADAKKQLADIFTRIGNKATAQDGLRELAEFMKRHPTMELEPFLAKASPFFQQYVQRNLELIALQDRQRELCVLRRYTITFIF